MDILKLTADFHLTNITKVIKVLMRSMCFLNDLKLAEVSPILKKKKNLKKITIDLLVFHLQVKRHLIKNCLTNRLQRVQ